MIRGSCNGVMYIGGVWMGDRSFGLGAIYLYIGFG